ncbi:TatD family hydrolase [Peptostreptococcus faecalis]|uniref:TatD family hydrolase n=1 Tax=Peptostreptococcus faecalis TaxID=2045015 RepID=UPI0015E125F7|nr:TatD family hydrolase [Peptostreptococcus faecalis]
MKKKIIFDFHTHISSRDELLQYYEDNIVPVVNCRNIREYEAVKKFIESVQLGNQTFFSDLYFSVGIHPFDSDIADEHFGEEYEDSIKNANFVGEIGMDEKWCNVPTDIQEKYFKKSLDLAEKYDLPVILHTKNMEDRIYSIIRHYDLIFIVHWYSSPDYIDEYIEKGCYFTVGPAVLIDDNVRKLVDKVPLNRLLLETDGIDALEWLFKESFKPEKIRAMLEKTLSEISIIKNMKLEEIENVVSKNSKKLLNTN